MSFPYMTPLTVSTGLALVASGQASEEIVVFKATTTCTCPSAWAMVNATAAATSNLTAVIYNRGTAGAGTTIMGTIGGSGSVWGATTPKAITLTNNTGVADGEYITALVTRIAASTASAWDMQVGVEWIPGSPATAG